MKILSKEKVLAERNGWSLDHARGFVEGEISRRRGIMPSKVAQVGIDEYCLGFRAGYYQRGNAGSMRPTSPAAPLGRLFGNAPKGA